MNRKSLLLVNADSKQHFLWRIGKMKKMAILALAILLIFPAFASGKERVLTAIWQQEICDDLDGWKLGWAVQSDPQIWDRADEVDIDYLGGTQTDFEADFTFISPDGQKVTYVFRMLAYDQVKNESAWTYAADPVVIDFESPQSPITFTITIKVVPESGNQ